MANKLNDLRAMAYSRAGGYCEKCGNRVPESWALHHRKLRSRGGQDEIANFLVLHHSCHNLASDSVHFNPAEAERKGYMVPSWQNPTECPLTLPDGSIVILTEEGTYRYLERKDNGW